MKLTDAEIEILWNKVEDATLIENEDGMLVLTAPWEGFEAGDAIESIWQWFDKNHSKGISFLLQMD